MRYQHQKIVKTVLEIIQADFRFFCYNLATDLAFKVGKDVGVLFVLFFVIVHIFNSQVLFILNVAFFEFLILSS
jgi:hypothetical protein